jgi:hypothetical protein
LIGSLLIAKTIGIVEVADLAARAAGSAPVANRTGHPSFDKLCRKPRQPLVLVKRPAIIKNFVALDIAELPQTLVKCCDAIGVGIG